VRDKQWKFEIQDSETISYPTLWLNKLKPLTLSNEDLAQLNQDYTIHLATVINNFIAKNSY
jgi:anhydro-N-acetylmuramic acid kinase